VSKLKSIVASVVCASLIAPLLPAAPAAAAPLPKPGISADDSIVLVDRRGRGRGYRRGNRGLGAAGIVGAIIAGTIIAAAIREGRADRRDIERCDRDFPDFDPRSGTYIDRYGDERICPYLD
jgi:hypothetical protein